MKMQLLKIEIKRAFLNLQFLFAILIGMGILIMHIFQIVLPDAVLLSRIDLNDKLMSKIFAIRQIPNLYMDYIEIFGGPYSMLYHFILPILTAIPYSMTIFTDRKKHYMDQIIMRSGSKEYHFTKLLVQFIVGGCVAVIPMILSFILTAMFLPAIKPVILSATYPIYGASLFSSIFYSYPFFYILILWIINFAGFGIISSMSYAFSDLMENRFMVALVPFILYFCQYVIASAFDKLSLKEFLRIAYIRTEWLEEIIFYIWSMVVVTVIALIIKIRRRDLL